MITARISNSIGAKGYDKDLFTDISNIFLMFQGRIALENMAGKSITFTTSTANTEVVVPHTLATIPTGRIVIAQDKAGSLYSSTTAWTKTNIYVKSDGTSVTFTIFLLK